MDSASTKAVLDFILQTLTIIVTPVLIMLAHKLTQEFAKRTGIALAEQQATLLDDAVMKGVAYAHEQSRKALKLNLPPIPGEDKRAMAVDFVVRNLQEQKTPEKARDHIANLIEARLHIDRPFTDSEKP